MRKLVVGAMVVAGCGGQTPAAVSTPVGSGAARPASVSTLVGGGAARPASVSTRSGGGASSPASLPTPRAEVGPWSAAVPKRVVPLPCPVASSRSGRAGRIVALGRGRFARVAGGKLVDVDANGSALDAVPIGAGAGEITTWALACGTRGQLAVTWVEDGNLRLARRPRGGALSAPVTLAQDALDESDRGKIALAFAPDGSLLVVYAIPHAVHGISVSPHGVVGADVVLGKASGVTQVAAEVVAAGRAVVAWDTIDGGEERGSPHVVSVATRAKGGRFRPAQVVDPGTTVDQDQSLNDPRAAMRLAVAPNGRAIVIYGTVTGDPSHLQYPLRVAESSPSGRFRAPLPLPTSGHPGDVAIRSDGAALAIWRDAGRLQAAVHGPGAPFEPSAALAGPAPTRAPTAAFLANGRAQVTWTTGDKTFTTTRPTP